MVENLQAQVKLLVELQGLDSQILKLEEELDAIPQRVRAIDEAFTLKTANLKVLEEKLKTIQLKKKEKELELDGKEGSIKKLQSQLGQVKTNKEYSALQQEIGRIKADDSIIEEAILHLFDDIDAEMKNIAGEKEAVKQEEAKASGEKKGLDEESIRLKGEIEKLRSARALLTPKIDKSHLDKYEKLLKTRDGLALVPVVGTSCQGCFKMLPAQVINEIRMHDAVVICDGCARMLYIEE